MNRINRSLVVLTMLVFLSGCSTATSQNSNSNVEVSDTQSQDTATASKVSSEDYAAVLKQYVNEAGEVDYAGLQKDRAALDRFNASLGAVSRVSYESWPESEKIAFWVNAYNSLTLQAIIDNYPTKSIRDIPGVWKSLKFKVLGEELTLDAIEHEILRKEFNEPRIHMALVCASVGCPVLRREPYRGEDLAAQLDDNTRMFLKVDRNFKLDGQNGKVHISSIFKWFGQDFETTYGTQSKFTKFNNKENSVLNFISSYLDDADRAELEQAKKVRYLDYDWSLNRQP